MDISVISDFADYFILCNGNSDRQLQALAEAAIEKVNEVYHFKPRVEGQPQEGWLLADFGNVVLHLFSPERRDYYRLEELWAKGRVLLHVQ